MHHPQTPPAFRAPEWGFLHPADTVHAAREQGRNRLESEPEETNGNGCTVASPRGWLALHVLSCGQGWSTSSASQS